MDEFEIFWKAYPRRVAKSSRKKSMASNRQNKTAAGRTAGRD